MDIESLKSVGWLVLWGALFLVMMRYGCGAHVKGGHGHHEGHGGRGRSETAADGNARDPVCGMEVDPRTALSFMHHGQHYYFCSTTCRDRFAQAPDQYTDPSMQGGHCHG